MLKRFQKALRTKLDDGAHAGQETYDNHRTRVLEKDRFKGMRFWNNDLLSNIEEVLE